MNSFDPRFSRKVDKSTIVCINTLDKREFGDKTAFSTAEEMSLFLAESQKMRGNEFGF